MDQTERFVYSEQENGQTPKQSPRSNQTWPMDKIRKSRFHSPLLSPVTPKRNYSISHSKSLLLQCFRDSKTDPLPCRRRFLASSCSDEGILMDGVLVTSATTTAKKKVASNSPSSSLLGRSSTRSSNMFSSPRSESGRKQEITRSSQQTSAGKDNTPSTKLDTPKDIIRSSQQASAGQGHKLETSPSTKLETPKAAAKSSKLKATAEPFTYTAMPQHRPVFPFPCNPPPRYACLRPQASHHMPHHIARLPNATTYQMNHYFNQSPVRSNLRISLLPATPTSSSYPNTNTNEPLFQTHGSSRSVDGLDTVTQNLDLSLPSADELDTVLQAQDLLPSSSYPNTNTSEPLVQTHGSRLESSSPSVDGLNTVTQNLDLYLPSADELDTMLQAQALSHSSDRVETIMRTIKEDWTPSDDRLETFTEAQTEFTSSHGRILPDDAFESYKYRKRLPIFTQLHQLPPLKEEEKEDK